MLVNGRDCSLVINTEHKEIEVPFSDETIREDVCILEEQPSIEGDGVCHVLKKNNGVKGCIITPLTKMTTPLLLYLAMGKKSKPNFITATRNMYRHNLDLIPIEDTEPFVLVQDRKNNQIIYEGCRVTDFEIRIMRNDYIKLKLNIKGDSTRKTYDKVDVPVRKNEEYFTGKNILYIVNNYINTNIYGITINTKKQGGTKTEVIIKRALISGEDLPPFIEDLDICAELFTDIYEERRKGTFSIELKKLVLISDETNVNSSDIVIGSLRYYVTGGMDMTVFTYGEENIA